MLNWEVRFFNRGLKRTFPRFFWISNQNLSAQASGFRLQLNWMFVWSPISVFNSRASGTVEPASSFVLANIFCILRKRDRNTLDYRINICQIMNFFACTQICFHYQCPRALPDFIDDYHSKPMNTTLYALFKALF